MQAHLPFLEVEQVSHTHSLWFWILCWAEVLSHVWLFASPWTVARQAPLSMGILQARILEWVAMPSSRGSSPPRHWTQVSRIAGGFFAARATCPGARCLLACAHAALLLLVPISFVVIWHHIVSTWYMQGIGLGAAHIKAIKQESSHQWNL